MYVEIITASDLKSSLNYKYLTNEVKLAGTRLAAFYQCCHTRPLSSSLQSGRLADSQPAESACTPRRAFHPAASALLPPHTHPSCLVGLSNPASPCPPCLPPSSTPPPPPLPSLFLCSTGLVKVSQSPVALLYRLQCFLFEWRLLTCEYRCKECLGCFSSSSTFCLVIFVFLPHTYLWMSVLFSLRSAVLDHDSGRRRLLCHLKARVTKKSTLGQFW